MHDELFVCFSDGKMICTRTPTVSPVANVFVGSDAAENPVAVTSAFSWSDFGDNASEIRRASGHASTVVLFCMKDPTARNERFVFKTWFAETLSREMLAKWAAKVLLGSSFYELPFVLVIDADMYQVDGEYSASTGWSLAATRIEGSAPDF